MIHVLPLLLCIIVLFNASLLSAEPVVVEQVDTRFASGEITSDTAKLLHKLTMKPVRAPDAEPEEPSEVETPPTVEFSGNSLSVYNQYSLGNVDLVILREENGGIECPEQFLIVEVKSDGSQSISEQFGSCGPISLVRTEGSSLLIEIPKYVAHPERLSRSELQLKERTVELYTWSNGSLQKSEIMKSESGKKRS